MSKETHYIRDGSGNVLAIYENEVLDELIIYGSSRLGSYNGKTTQGKRTLGNKKYELSNHLGNVLTVTSDNKIGIGTNGIADYYEPLVISESDYYPFGMAMKERSFSNEEYRFGFNGMEEERDIAVSKTDFGGRIYDELSGRWFSVDALTGKYSDLTPYLFSGNNPILFVDFDGKDFGVKVNHNDKTIVIVSNIYTTSAKAYEQALASAKIWNGKNTITDGYTVTFQIKVNNPVSVTESEVVDAFSTVNFYRNNGSLRGNLYRRYEELLARNKNLKLATDDPIGNSYASNNGPRSRLVSGDTFVGGQTGSGKYVDMNTHNTKGNMGDYQDLVTHEFAHLFGLDDEDANNDGITEPYYPGDGGIMEYKGVNLSAISNNDVRAILKFAKDALSNQTKIDEANVELLENIGQSNDTNPLGI